MIDKEKLKNYSRLKQTATSMCDSRLPSWTRKEKKKEKGTAFFFVCLFVFYKEYSQNSQWNLNEICGLDGGNRSMSISFW